MDHGTTATAIADVSMLAWCATSSAFSGARELVAFDFDFKNVSGPGSNSGLASPPWKAWAEYSEAP